MKFYIINCFLIVACVIQYGISIPLFADTADELIKFDERVKRDLDYDSSSDEDDKNKATTTASAGKPSGSSSSSSSSEESPKPDNSYEKQIKELEKLQEKIKKAQELLASKSKVKAKSNSDTFVFRPPGWTSPAPPTQESLLERHRQAMANLSQGLKDAVKKFEEARHKNQTIDFPGATENQNVQKRSVNLNELRDELKERLVQIRARRASRKERAADKTTKSDQSLLQLLTDIQTMTAQVRDIRLQIKENRE